MLVSLLILFNFSLVDIAADILIVLLQFSDSSHCFIIIVIIFFSFVAVLLCYFLPEIPSERPLDVIAYILSVQF